MGGVGRGKNKVERLPTKRTKSVDFVWMEKLRHDCGLQNGSVIRSVSFRKCNFVSQNTFLIIKMYRNQ